MVADRKHLRELDPEQLEHLATLVTISELLNESYDVQLVLERVLDVVLETMGAQRGFVMLDRGGLEPEVAASRGIGPWSSNVVRRVLDEGAPVFSVDVQGDERFAASESLKMLGTRCILCVPLQTRGRRIGLIYVDSCASDTLFFAHDLKLLQIIAGMSAAAIERARFVTESLRNEKLAALGTMVAGIAHELSDPLVAISGAAELLEADGLGPDLAAMARSIEEEAGRCLEMVRSLLQAGRSGSTPRAPVPVPEVISAAAGLLAPVFKEQGSTLEVDCPPDLPPVSGHRDQLVQVLRNLLSNARLAVEGRPGGGVVRVQASSREGEVRIQVADDGAGIPPEILGRVFDPFFTRRESGEGSGLGLSIVHRLVTEHGGTIRVHNHPDGGAVFTVTLPAA